MTAPSTSEHSFDGVVRDALSPDAFGDEGPPSTAESRVGLRHLLMSQTEPLLELQAAPAGLDVEVCEVGIFDTEDPAQAVRPGELVLAVGVRGRAVLPVLRAAGTAGAAAVVIKLDRPGQTTMLGEAAAEAGVALLSVRRETRWECVDSLVRTVLGSGEPVAPAEHEANGDLFSLAQTTAVLTGGIVSIEDTAHRVLAYSRSSDEGDDLRRMSILGRQGPERYLSTMREWGVFEHLRTSDTVIAVEAHPELGIRRRLAIGVRARNQPLGTIWVQEGSRPLAPRSEQALLGAARVAALHLVRRRREVSADTRLTQTLVAGLLDGSTGPQSLAMHLRLDQRRPAAVIGFALRPLDRGAAGGGGDRQEGNEQEGSVEFTRAEVTGLISVHAAARHHSALVAPVGTHVYVLLPEMPAGLTPAIVRGWAREIVEAAKSHLGVSLQAAVGPIAPDLSGAALSRRDVDRVLGAMARGGVVAEVASLDEVWAQVLTGEVLAVLAERPDLRDPRLTALAERDRRSGTEYVASLLTYLDAFGDLATAAAQLHIHRNTLRYRIRRAEELTGLDLSHPQQRLMAMLQLRLPPGDLP
ncbi:PucR family transcriptional regulator [Streptomyces sp. NPDC015127]|uniref:PucR family transcriptional regulator n=1 Tax=Streptomyces sp. NPDC015127 TaxID=3364939 RepID=UPI0036FA09CB